MRAAFYECDVTPPLGGYMSGHYRKDIAEDVEERLYSKALVVEQDGEIAAIVAVDTLIVPEEMRDIVTKRIYEYTGIAPERVCIHSNHTHTGAPVCDSPEINCFADVTYRDVFYRLTADAVILAYKRLGESEVTVKYGKVAVPGMAFNRTGMLEDGTLVTHLKGRENLIGPLAGSDDDLSVVYVEKEGKPIGAVVNFGMHQDGRKGAQSYSGDFSSLMAIALKEEFGNQFVSLFVNGACGDINHTDIHRTTPAAQREYEVSGRTLAAAAAKAIKRAEEIDGVVSIITEMIPIKRRIADLDYVNEWLKKVKSYKVKRNLLYYFSTNEAEYSELYVQAIRIGDVCIYTLPGEIFVNIGLEIKEKSPFVKNMIVENCNADCGYIPTKECFCEKSMLYETLLCHHSNLVPEAAEILTEKALELGNKVYAQEE